MKVTGVETGSITTYYAVDVENDSQQAMSEGSYTVCDMYDINSDSHEYEITPEPANEKDKMLLLDAIAGTSTFENWLPGE